MTPVDAPSDRPRIVVAGGGPAGLEALLTLADRLSPGDRDLALVAPNRALGYRPLSSVGEFATHPLHELSLADLTAEVGAELVRDAIAFVDEERRRALTHDGDWIDFDHLLLAVGTAAIAPPGGWSIWPPQGDPEALGALIADLRAGDADRVAVIVPTYTGWPLAGFELAAILGSTPRESGETRVTLFTEDARPLALLGEEAEALVAAELAAANVEMVAGREVRPVREEVGIGGADWLTALLHPRRRAPGLPTAVPIEVGGERHEFDRVLSLPRVLGPGIGGASSDEHRYLIVDEAGRVAGSERVWAAGDCTSFPLKHSTLAVAQADAVADHLASAAGASTDPPVREPKLAGILVSGAAARWWSENANLPQGVEAATHCLWWPPGKVLGGRLAHYIARRDPAARPLLLGHPHGTAVEVSFAPPVADRVARRRTAAAGSEHELGEDVLDRRTYALHRVERESSELLGELEAAREQDRERSRAVLERLNAAGYLVKHESDR